MNLKRVVITLLAVPLAITLLLGITACSENTPQDNSTEVQQTEAKKVSYFDACEELPTPDSLINVSETSSFNLSNDDGSTSQKFTYSFEGKDDVQGEIDQYLSDLKEYGFMVNDAGESKWAILSQEEKVATVSIDEDSTQELEITIFGKSARVSVKEVSIGQAIETEKYSFTLSSVEWAKEVYPPDTSGAYTYLKEQPNKTYCIIKGTFKYLGESHFNFSNTSAQFINMNNKYNFYGTVSYAYNTGGSTGLNGLTSFYTLEPLSEVPLYITSSISDEVADDFTGGALEWTFQDGTTYRFNFA